MTKPIILVKICYKLLYVIQGVETQVETQVWLKSVKKFDKGVNAQKESLKKSSGVHASSRKATKKCAMKTKQEKNTGA